MTAPPISSSAAVVGPSIERTGLRSDRVSHREGKQTYSVMADGDFDPIAFRRLVHWFTLGLRPTSLMRD